MSDSLFLRLKSLNVRTMRGVTTSKNVIRVAAMHNLREIQAELGATAASGIDPARMAMNYQLRGPDTAVGVADLALALLDNAGVKNLRRDACMALELVFSLPPSAGVDQREYFAAAVTWADSYFNAPILSAAVHLDEAAPHCHVLVLPLVAGRMNGGALAGGPSKIRMMQSDFQQQVGQRFGLAHQPRAKRLSPANTNTAGRMVLEAMQAHPERLNDSILRDALAAALGQHHATLMPLLGLALPTCGKPAGKPKTKSFVSIMTASKPERKHRARKSIDVAHTMSIDVDVSSTGARTPKIRQRLCSVDIARPSQAFQPNIEEPSDHLRAKSASPSSATNSATGQQASSSSAAQPSTTGQQRERSTTGSEVRPSGQQGSDGMATHHATVEGVLSFEGISLVVITNPAGDQAASTSTGPAPAKGKPALQQVGHHQDAQDRAAAEAQAGQHLSSSIDPATTAPTKRTTTGGQNGTDPLPIGRSAPASNFGKHKGAALKVASTVQRESLTTATAQYHPASGNVPENLGACPSKLPASSADQVAQAVTLKRRANTENTESAKLAITAGTKRELTAAKRSTGKPATTSRTSTTRRQAASIEHETPCNATTSHATPSKRAKAATVSPTSAPAAPCTSKHEPATCAPSRVSSSLTSASTTGTAPSTRLRTRRSEVRKSDFGTSVESLAASSSATPALRQSNIDTNQPDEIRRLGYPAPISASILTMGPAKEDTLKLELTATPGAALHSAENSAQHNQTHENGRHDATTPEHDPAPAPHIDGSATAPEMEPAHDGEPSRHRLVPDTARLVEQAPPIGGPLAGAGMPALKGDLQHEDGASDYERHRDEDHPAEHWDVDLGEFVTAPPVPARRTTWRDAEDLGNAWHEARPAALDAAMASIQAVLR
jgi:hypothetical protein